MKKSILLQFLICVTICSCKKEAQIALSKNIDNYFYFELPDSNYKFKVKIDEIIKTVVMDEFVVKDNEYEVGSNINGYTLKLRLSITNPYNKIMVNVSFPAESYITSIYDKDFVTEGAYSKRIGRYIIPEVHDIKNIKLKRNKSDDCSGNGLCLNFQPKETKSFILYYSNPIKDTIKNLTLVGYKLTKTDEKRTAFSDATGVIFNVNTNKIVGEQKF